MRRACACRFWGLRVSWTIISEDEARLHWDGWIKQFDFTSPFQSFAMGMKQKAFNRVICFCVFRTETGEVKSMALCFVKHRAAGFAFIACQGGPAGDAEYWGGLPQALKKHLKVIGLYLRMRCDMPREQGLLDSLQRTGWQAVPETAGSNRTGVLDLATDLDDLKKAMTDRWRENLRLSAKSNLVLRHCEAWEVDAVIASHLEMTDRKKFSSTMTADRIRALFNCRGTDIQFLCAASQTGELLAFRCVLTLGTQAVDYIAATTQAGRKQRASFALLWHEIQYLKARGIRDYDLGGIDAVNNPGVTQFKMGAGCEERVLLGEFEKSTWAPMQRFVSLALRARMTLAAWLSKEEPGETKEARGAR